MKSSLYTRLLLVFLSAFLVFSGITLFVDRNILLPNFTSLEREHTTANIQRVVDSINNELYHLSLLTADWAIWDDTYNYIHDHNKNYETSNLVPSTFTANKVNLILYLNEQGEMIYGKAVSKDFETPITISPFDLSHYPEDFPLLPTQSGGVPLDKENIKSLVMTSAGPMLCSANLILNSNEDGPPRGTLIMGRFLSEELLENLARMTRIEFTIEPVSSQDDKANIVAVNGPKRNNLSLQTYEDTIVAKQLLYDFYDEPALVVSIKENRSIYQQGVKSLLISFSITLVSTCIVLTLMMFIIQKSVLTPIRNLSEYVVNWGKDQKSDKNQTHVGAAREISELSKKFKNLIATLENQKHELGETNLTLVNQTKKLKEAESKLKKLDELKSEFISTAAHELSTPIASVMGYVELLIDPEMSSKFDDEKKKDFLFEVYSNSERLTKLVEDILDVSRIELGQKIPLLKTPVNVQDLIKKAIQPLALKTSHTLRYDVKPEVPETIVMDEFRILQVMENLLSNAIKYSAEGSEIVTNVELDGQFCRFSIADNGIGMTPQQSARIFDKFYRVETSDTAVHGLGLGMSIVKQIIEDHDGDIVVQSTVGKGSTVSFSLPIDA